jgi:hypothetical protein
VKRLVHEILKGPGTSLHKKAVIDGAITAAVKALKTGPLNVLLFGESQKIVSSGISKAWLFRHISSLQNSYAPWDVLDVLQCLVKAARPRVSSAKVTATVETAFTKIPLLSIILLYDPDLFDGMLEQVALDLAIVHLAHLDPQFRDAYFSIEDLSQISSPTAVVSLYLECLQIGYTLGAESLELAHPAIVLDSLAVLKRAISQGRDGALSILLERHQASLSNQETQDLFLFAVSDIKFAKGLRVLTSSNQFMTGLSYWTVVRGFELAQRARKPVLSYILLLSPEVTALLPQQMLQQARSRLLSVVAQESASRGTSGLARVLQRLEQTAQIQHLVGHVP